MALGHPQGQECFSQILTYYLFVGYNILSHQAKTLYHTIPALYVLNDQWCQRLLTRPRKT